MSRRDISDFCINVGVFLVHSQLYVTQTKAVPWMKSFTQRLWWLMGKMNLVVDGENEFGG